MSVSPRLSSLVHRASVRHQRIRLQPKRQSARGRWSRNRAGSKCSRMPQSLVAIAVRSGYSAQDWRTVVHLMNDNVGAQVPDRQLPILVKYLAENFPGKTAAARPWSSLVRRRLFLRKWVLPPTPGFSRPHDLACSDARSEAFGTLGRWRMCWGASTRQAAISLNTISTRRCLVRTWPRRRPRWRNLVHGQLRGLYRQTRQRRHWQNHRIQIAESGRARPTHACV